MYLENILPTSLSQIKVIYLPIFLFIFNELYVFGLWLEILECSLGRQTYINKDLTDISGCQMVDTLTTYWCFHSSSKGLEICILISCLFENPWWSPKLKPQNEPLYFQKKHSPSPTKFSWSNLSHYMIFCNISYFFMLLFWGKVSKIM